MARKNKAKHIMKTADLETRINRKMMELSNALSKQCPHSGCRHSYAPRGPFMLETRINRKMMELSNALSNMIELLEFPTEGKAALCPDTRHWKKEFLSSHLARVESSTCTNHHCGPGEGGV